MPHFNDPEYFHRREAVQREMAANAADPAIARIHSDLARLYADQAQAARPSLRLVL